MDPIELLQLCREGAVRGAPSDLVIPHVFVGGEFEDMWVREPEKVKQLLDELLCADHPGDGLELLLRSGILGTLMPEVTEIVGLGEDPASALHKNVWEHTKQVVANVPNQLELRWAALMHDIGKARTRRFDGRKVSFHNHDVVGARMLDRIDQRIDLFRNDETQFITVRMLVLNHLRPANYKRSWGDSGVRRLLVDLGGMRNFDRLMALSRADLTTKNPRKRDQAIARGNELEARVKQVYIDDQAPKLPKGTMGIILSKVAAKPGAWCNDLRDTLEGMMALGVLPADKDVEFYVAEGLKIVEQAADGVTDA